MSITKDERKKLFSLFENLDEEEIVNRPEKNINSNILLIDGNNTFIRAFSANPALNDDGEHVGGIDGFLKSIGYAVRILKPTRCIVVFDGKGGSQRRRSIFKEYKEKRRTRIRLNRIYEDITTPDLEERSVLEQIQKVVMLCNNLPLTLMAIDNIEADDTISFLATEVFDNESTETIHIMSNDKDFYQLVNDKVAVYSPTKKKIYGKSEILDEFGVSSKNFIIFKILNGDKSDNIDGVKGIGLKTAIKLFPQLIEDEEFTVDTMLKYAEDHVNSKLKGFNSIHESKQLVERNYALMQLGETDISSFSKIKIQDLVDKKVEPSNVYEFTKLLKKYKMFSVFRNHNVWIRETFDILDFYAKQS